MVSNTKKIIVEVPHRISGFFEIVDKENGIPIKNPEKIGSRGAGFNVSGVGKTVISCKKLEKEEESLCSIYINEEKLNHKAETTYFIYNYIRKLIDYPINIKIEHFFDLPVGCGYGASGSGALGTIFGLNKKIAHIAEVVNKTGLGTVCGQLGRGLCVLKEPGYPCNHERLKSPNDLIVMCGSFGAIQTKSILSDEKLSSSIKKAGKIALNKLLLEPNYKNFIKASYEFVDNTQIMNALNLERVSDLINDLRKLGIIGASMNQLGRSVYAFCKREKENEVFEIFNSYKPEIKMVKLTINSQKTINFREN
ncbi:MAG: hypothetical protein ACTSQW_10575 [Promethearchaeota archaeon]